MMSVGSSVYRSWQAAVATIVGSTVLACGGAVASEGSGASQSGARGDSPAEPPAPPSPAKPDFTIEPANVAEGREQCQRPPTDWEPTEHPDLADYAGHHWVMCARPTASGVVIPSTSWHMFLGADRTYVIEGRPHETWDYGLVIPERRTMVIPFPVDDANGYGMGRGIPHQAHGAIHWLRLAVDPSESGLLEPKLHGMSEAIFVRVKAP
jgi:hypothetical protein